MKQRAWGLVCLGCGDGFIRGTVRIVTGINAARLTVDPVEKICPICGHARVYTESKIQGSMNSPAAWNEDIRVKLEAAIAAKQQRRRELKTFKRYKRLMTKAGMSSSRYYQSL
jgi:hypothetical protein